VRTKVRSAAGLLALLAAGVVAGVVSAQAVGQVGLPTISLPSVSVPLPPPPPVPPVPVPPAPPVPVPPAPVPTPPTPPAPPTPALPAPLPSVPSPSAPPAAAPGSSVPAAGAPGQPGSAPVSIPAAGTSSSATYYTAERRRQPAGQTRSQRRARVTRLNASPRRLDRTSKRRAIRITFRLTAPARVVFVVRGPAPSCEVVGRFSVRGRKGVNRVRFKGRVGRRTLGPGTYELAAHPAGQEQRTRRTVVMIGTQPRDRFDCSEPAAAELFFAGALPFAADADSTAIKRATRQAPATKKRDRSRGVLPAIRRKIREIPDAIAIPRPPTPRDVADSPPSVLGLLALALLALSAVAILAYVIRFLRGPNTKSA
jgi:hypothetical protein